MTFSGAIIFVTCALGCAGVAQARPLASADAVPHRMSGFNRQMARITTSTSSSEKPARLSRYQESLDAARHVALAPTATAPAGALAVKFNRFVGRSDRAPVSVRPRAILTPAARPAAVRR